MYTQGSSEFNTLIETPNNQSLIKRLVLVDDGTEIENVLSVNLVSSSSQDELQIGTTNMAYIEVSAVTDKILTNREVRLECGVKLSNGTIEYAPIGVYTIQKPKGDIDGISFKANDKMQKFEKPYISSLTYPTTSDKVLEELCNMCGVELATHIDNPISISEKLDGYTCREMLGYIAGIHAKFACFDRLGKLNLRWYSNIPIEKKIGLIYKFSKAENDFTVSKIELAKDAETKYTSGSGFGVVYHSNPLATQEIADSIFSKLNGFTYNATSLDILDDIRLDLGDVIKVTYLDGMDYLVPCMSLKQNFSQGSTTIEAYSKTEEENEYKYTGPTTKYIERVAHELLIANRIIATKVDAEYVQAHAITTDNLEAITANITNLVVEQIKGQYADIHLANIDIADIGQFFADSGLLKDVTIVEGHITGELDAVRINADVIKTGTLSVDRLLVTGKDSIVYQINVDSSGLTKAELEDEVYQKYLNGTNIVANSITATQLNVSEIFADKTVTNTLFAQNITATGTITGATLIGANADIEKGNIGGFSISENRLVSTNSEGNTVVLDPKGEDVRGCSVYVYSSNDDRPYGITTSGGIVAKSLYVFGGSSFYEPTEFLSGIRVTGTVLCNTIKTYQGIQVPMGQGGTYLDSVTNKDRASIYVYNASATNSYHPIITAMTSSGHTWNLGAIGDVFGFSAFKSDRATNGVDYYCWWDIAQGYMGTNFKVRATRFEFGSNFEFGLDPLGQVWASNIYIGKGSAYYVFNSSGTAINSIYMDTSNILRFGYGAGTIYVGLHGTTSRTMIFGTRIDFCANTAGTSETNPALSLVSGAGGANLYFRPTSTQGVATYLGDVSYRFNTVYCQTLDQSSDKNDKKNICDISDKYIELWDKLSVKTFRYINDDKIVRVGLIAQDVEEWALKVGLTLEDCGFIGKRYVDNDTYKGYKYSLDYISMAMITMAKVKQIVDIINQHDKRIQDLEDEIAILKSLINHMQSQYA